MAIHDCGPVVFQDSQSNARICSNFENPTFGKPIGEPDLFQFYLFALLRAAMTVCPSSPEINKLVSEISINTYCPPSTSVLGFTQSKEKGAPFPVPGATHPFNMLSSYRGHIRYYCKGAAYCPQDCTTVNDSFGPQGIKSEAAPADERAC